MMLRISTGLQASLRAGVRSTLAALLEAPESSLQVAVQPRNFSSTSLITSNGGGSGSGLGLVASYSISVIVTPPVRCQTAADRAERVLMPRPLASLQHIGIGHETALRAQVHRGEGSKKHVAYGMAMMRL